MIGAKDKYFPILVSTLKHMMGLGMDGEVCADNYRQIESFLKKLNLEDLNQRIKLLCFKTIKFNPECVICKIARYVFNETFFH